MKLTVKNLGAIKNGEIDLDKNLIILTGPNNTGKSYLTYILYAIHKLETLSIDRIKINRTLTAEFKESQVASPNLSENNTIFFKNIFSHHESLFAKIVKDAVSANFVKIFASANIKPVINITIKDVDFYKKSNEIEGFHLKDEELRTVFGGGKVVDAPLRQSSIPGIRNEEDFAAFYAAVTMSGQLVNSSFFGNAYSFPSERTAINLFARDIISRKAGSRDDMALRVLSGEDVSEIARSIKKEQNTNPKYPLAINDYVNFVNSFDGSTQKSKLSHLASDLETLVLGGGISLSEFKQIIFTPHDSKQPLELHESSSLVKSLSFLVIYLRYFASKGDLVIIDEPEINLHPNLQIAIARLFAKMINSGLKLILSTHSDYLIKQLNNLILLHGLNQNRKYKPFVKKHGYKVEELINKEQVGAYYLHNNTIESINMEANGLEVPSINAAIRQVDGLAEELFLETEES